MHIPTQGTLVWEILLTVVLMWNKTQKLSSLGLEVQHFFSELPVNNSDPS
jgi:hypothetical protein